MAPQSFTSHESGVCTFFRFSVAVSFYKNNFKNLKGTFIC